MNQKVVIYIILSAILLYLYYLKRDLAIFAAFVVVVAGTLIFGDTRPNGIEGFNADNDCAKLGFTAVKLDKNDLGGSLDMVMKQLSTVADKHWPYDTMAGKIKDGEKTKAFETFVKEFQKEAKDIDEKEDKMMNMFILGSAEAYEKRKMAELLTQVKEPEKLEGVITGGKITLKLLEKVSKSSKIDSSFKKTLEYLICLCKHWTNIYKAIQKANGGGGSDEGGDEEEKPKKKKTKPTKKKSKKADEEDADDAEDE